MTCLRRFRTRLMQLRPARLLMLCALALLAGLATDWFSEQRIFFPRNDFPVFQTLPAAGGALEQ